MFCDVLFEQLHGFCDTSGKAHCACVYIRVLCQHRLRARLLASKYHLILSKPLSSPCFELLLCVLLSRLIDSSQKALETELVLENVCLWSDSQMALWWLKQVNKRWSVWVQNRIEYVWALIEPSRWYYVSTYCNPSNFSTRFNLLRSFRFSSLWWEGPSYLKQDCSHWPLEEIISSDLARQEKRSGNHSLFVTHGLAGIGKVIDHCRFSSFQQLLRVTNYVLRFIGNLKTRLINTVELRDNDICTEEN